MASDEETQAKLVVGLGNPGRRYENTKHNIGFEVLAGLARTFHASTPRIKFQGEFSEARINNRRVFLLAPGTYMNRSGSSVQPARDFYKLRNRDILVICDDFALPMGKLRFRASGSSGGQKGLHDVLQRLGAEIPRLRIGIGPVPPNWEISDYVLSKFSSNERAVVDEAVQRAVHGVVDWIAHDIQYCMNHYNANQLEK